ncbi:MAG: hypothetical protein R3277_07710 [Brumimicrobium sp.]|nr:hypothetical protein [Brumimicrobium sp.]
MDNSRKNKRNMYTVVLETCKENTSIWQNIPAFVSAVNDLEAKLQTFSATAEDRLMDTKHITKKKIALIHELHNKVYIMVKLIRAYAASTGNESLAFEYSLTKKSLLVGGAKATINRFNNVVKKANELAPDLEDFGLTQQFLQELTQKVEEAKIVIWEPRLKIIQRKALTRKLHELTDELDNIVYVRLTGMVDLLHYDHPVFHAKFMDARNIIDHKRRRSANTPDTSPDSESPPASGIDNST